jgi:uncharacterized membrane protein SpoIIM required for sporulation
MREALFIKRNRDKWIRYQREQTQDPDEQAERFITLLDDLAYSRTFYPQSKVTRWINSIAVGIYQHIYQNKKEKYKRLLTFWTEELPLLVRRHHKVFLFTFLFFSLCLSIGVISSSKDDLFVKTILGEEYVAMTEDNISKGDPFGVYRDDDKFSMFIRIAANNIKVSLRAFVFGIFFGIGTLYILFYNGLMVGAFEYLFFAKGLGWQSVMVIWIHGTIEISSVIIAGTAGLIVGRSILFPETYSRFQSFKNGIRDALKLAIALVPFFIVAALLESYVTYLMSNTFTKQNSAGLPVWLGAFILLASAGFIAWYFVWYPIQVQRRHHAMQAAASSLPQTIVWQ